MKVVILTSSMYGTASHHLPYLLAEKDISVAMVIYNEGAIPNKNKFYRKKIQKIFRIGFLGTINGIRMRKWYGENVLKYTPIENLEELCKKHTIPFFVTPSLNTETTVELFKKSGADIGLSLGNGYIGKKVFGIPPLGMLNIHHEILPQYQNAQSVIWQLYNGSPITGYTIHKIDKGIDTGAILLTESVPIVFEKSLADTVSHSIAALYDKSAKGLVDVLNDFETYNNAAKPQGKGNSYTTPAIWQYFKIYRQFRKLRGK